MSKLTADIFHDKQRRVFKLMLKLYGDDSSLIVNALHEMAARVALSTGIEPEAFAAGMKHHWDFLANAINDSAEPRH